ncbi:hypothetical protein BDM02DRAFT_1936668 [Thelephora ganbajun]|uniref:Uncharacterized protein n=1 Tax=Thelephora ganbajun TaxID=370292 RepID=A0ACB6ZHW5_THEGA|nr:hypothetical protein BDM02DRAFT_1936668 [Thelephora ganbajun]
MRRHGGENWTAKPHTRYLDHRPPGPPPPQRSLCIRHFASMNSFETYPTAWTTRVKGLRRYSPSHVAVNRSRDRSWTFCGDVRLICAPSSGPYLQTPGRSQMVFLNLSQDEWERFKKYTARVIALGIPKMGHLHKSMSSGRPRTWISVETIQLLGMELQRGGFWPRVCRLKCNIDWDFLPFISSFLTSTIINIDLTLPRERNLLLQPTLSLLKQTCRQLQSLTMDIDASDPPCGGEMGRLIFASRHTLRCIKIRSSTPPDIFPVIFDLPRLQDLILRELHLPNEVPPRMLPYLKTICFFGTRGPNLTQFFRGLPAQRLATVTIFRGEIIQLPALLDSMRGATGIMDALHLSPVTALDPPSISLLCSFINLTSLTIGCVCEGLVGPCSFAPTDRDISQLGGALPHIRILNLSPGCRGPRHVTFVSLICLSRMCGNLGSLAIRVDFASIIDSDQLNHNNASLGANSARPQRTRSRLGTLIVGNSPLPDTPHCEWVTALALVSIFPSIKVIFSYCDGEMLKRWDEVRDDVFVCQKIFYITNVRVFQSLELSAHRPQIALTTVVGCSRSCVLWDDTTVFPSNSSQLWGLS